jgi:hypothetical protein
MSRAWVTYAAPDLKDNWEELKKPSAMDAFEKGLAKASTSNAETVAKAKMIFEEPQKILAERSLLKTKLQKNILGYVAGGHLHGFGYEMPRRLSDAPAAIPKAAWAGHCDWNEGRLSYRGLEFVDVRLTTNRIRNEVLERGTVDTTPIRPNGRPSVAPAVKAAFHALNTAGEIDPEAPQMSHYPKVRRWLELNHPDLPVPPAHMSDKTIHKYFSNLFNELKKIHNL